MIIKAKRIKKVMTAVGWIPVDADTFKLGQFVIEDKSDGAAVRTAACDGFTFESEGEILTGRIEAILSVK